MITSNEFNMRHLCLLNETKIFKRICKLSKETYERRLLINVILQEMHERMVYETDKREEMNRIGEYSNPDKGDLYSSFNEIYYFMHVLIQSCKFIFYISLALREF